MDVNVVLRVRMAGFESASEAADHAAHVLMADGTVMGIGFLPAEGATHFHVMSCDCEQPRVPDEDEREGVA